MASARNLVLDFVREHEFEEPTQDECASCLKGFLSAARFQHSKYYRLGHAYSKDELMIVIESMWSAGLIMMTGKTNALSLPVHHSKTSSSSLMGTSVAIPALGSGPAPAGVSTQARSSPANAAGSFLIVPPSVSGAPHTSTSAQSSASRGLASASSGSFASGSAPSTSSGSGGPTPAPTAASSGSESRAGPKSEPRLSKEQQAVYDLVVVKGYSVFFTGSAGTGKSFLMKRIIQGLKERAAQRGKKDAVFVTAPTGIAACNIGGTTINSFGGIGQQITSVENSLKSINGRGAQGPAGRWRSAESLVIDEISMLDGDQFDKYEELARKVRGKPAVFGGLQLVMCGDFHQLPPVSGRGEPPKKFAFEAQCWSRLVRCSVMLREVHRQKDQRMVDMLNSLRVGVVPPGTRELLESAGRGMAEREARGIIPTRLYARSDEVDRRNKEQLEKLAGRMVQYSAQDTGSDPYREQLAKNSNAPTLLQLKVGAQVILLKNLDSERGLVNGARGVVRGFVREDAVLGNKGGDGDGEDGPGASSSAGASGEAFRWLPQIEFASFSGEGSTTVSISPAEYTIELGSRVVANRTQIPLKLAWALTIHKSQGLTIDMLEVSLKNIFDCGQAYVAISRAVTLECLRVFDFTPSAIKADPKVLAFYKGLASAAEAQASTAGGAAATSSSSSSSASSSAAFGHAAAAAAREPVPGPRAKPAFGMQSGVAAPKGTLFYKAPSPTSASKAASSGIGSSSSGVGSHHSSSSANSNSGNVAHSNNGGAAASAGGAYAALAGHKRPASAVAPQGAAHHAGPASKQAFTAHSVAVAPPRYGALGLPAAGGSSHHPQGAAAHAGGRGAAPAVLASSRVVVTQAQLDSEVIGDDFFDDEFS